MRAGVGTGMRGVAIATLIAGLIATLAAGWGCGGDERPTDDDSAAAPAAQGEVIERETELGPVRATITVQPEEPSLGDPITLTLEVVAEPGVTVEMPSFGEALGRFQIVQFVPREDIRSGAWTATQTYTLQAPMSGKQRIPPLRIEFVDERPGQVADAGVAQTDDGAEDGVKVQEILTEEIALEVASVLPDGAVAEELGEARGALPVDTSAPLWKRPWLWLGLALIVALVAGVLGVRAWRQAARQKRRESAYDVAIARLSRLESRGLPAPEQADAWYVELSGIIRRYLEDRYSLRAPELTTEEFLQVARTAGQLTAEHRELLSTFLIGCDRVKFARYAPEDEESKQALESARSFLQDTRLHESAASLAEPRRKEGEP